MKITKADITKGNWSVDKDFVKIKDSNDYEIANISYKNVGWIRGENNAKAIAALPQAYDALAWVLELLHERNEHPLTQDTIKKALIEAGYKIED